MAGKSKEKACGDRDDEGESLTEKLINLASLNKDQDDEQGDGAGEMAISKAVEKDLSNERYDIGSNTAKYSRESTLNPECRCSELESQINRIEKDILTLMHRVEERELNETFSTCTADTCQTEKKRLTGDLESANTLIKELGNLRVTPFELSPSS